MGIEKYLLLLKLYVTELALSHIHIIIIIRIIIIIVIVNFNIVLLSVRYFCAKGFQAAEFLCARPLVLLLWLD